MNGLQHTPGPWAVGAPERVLGCDARGQIYIHAKDLTVATVLDGSRLANAQLIARAPQLLHDAMTMALRLYGESDDSFAPETREVMARWRPLVEAELARAAS